MCTDSNAPKYARSLLKLEESLSCKEGFCNHGALCYYELYGAYGDRKPCVGMRRGVKSCLDALDLAGVELRHSHHVPFPLPSQGVAE